MVVLPIVSVRVVLMKRVIHLGCRRRRRKRRMGRKMFRDLADACSRSLASTISRFFFPYLKNY